MNFVEILVRLRETFPWLADTEVRCPELCYYRDPFARPGEDTIPVYIRPLDMIVHLNDEHRWTRERVADYLETLAEEQGESLEFPVP